MLWPLLCSFVFCFVCAVCIFRLHASLRSGTERFGLSEAALSGSVAECRRLRLVPAPQSLAKRRGAPTITPKSALKALLWSAAAPQSLAKRRGAPAITPEIRSQGVTLGQRCGPVHVKADRKLRYAHALSYPRTAHMDRRSQYIAGAWYKLLKFGRNSYSFNLVISHQDDTQASCKWSCSCRRCRRTSGASFTMQR